MMGIAEKIANAKETSWVTEGLSDAEVKTVMELAKISARIERCRLEMGMTQHEFAKYMGVTQGMVSKWENREYNFTIRSLNEICQKIDLELTVSLDKPCSRVDYKIIKWEKEQVKSSVSKNGWCKVSVNKEAIA
ncbi:MAG: helix-turn-helix domain-containing protein [Eubacterium sp.]|nr:helix-turn-helix domain-containing protein [Eubacterium sp.]